MFVSRHPWSLSDRAAVNHGQSGVAAILQFSIIAVSSTAGRLQRLQLEFRCSRWELQHQQGA